MVTELTEALPAPPEPEVPDWMHDPPTRSMLVGTDARFSELVTVTQLLVDPARLAGVVNVTLNWVEALVVTEVGEAAMAVTAPVGVPMV